MNSFRILGSVSILVAMLSLLAGCSRSKQGSGDSPVVRVDQDDEKKVVNPQEEDVASQATKTLSEIPDEPVQSTPSAVPSNEKVSGNQPDDSATFKQKMLHR